MAYHLFAAGGSLYKVTTAGVATALTLPTGITLSSTRKARMAVLGRNVVIVNGPTRSLMVDPLTTVRPMIIAAPSAAPLLAQGSSGAYSGTVACKYTFIIKDPNTGALLSESGFSPISATVTVAAKYLNVTGVQVSPDASVTHRRFYRTATGPGTQYFTWFDLEGNTVTAGTDDASDAALSIASAPTDLGGAPGMAIGTYMTNAVSWKDRIWGVGDIAVDDLLFSGNKKSYGFPLANKFSISPVGGDQFGITGLLPRRDELGVGKRGVLWKVVPTASSFDIIKVKEGAGVWATDSVVVVDDIAYYLGENAFYAWGPTGANTVSDDKARGWFATDTYFNRAQFPNAVAKYNPKYHGIELHLANLASSNLDRWVFLDLDKMKWWGPHKTDAFTPTWAGQLVDANGFKVPFMASSAGYIYSQNQTTFGDDGTAIAVDWIGKRHDGDSPKITKHWSQPTLVSKVQTAAGNGAFIVSVGNLDASPTQTFKPDMRSDTNRFGECGPGKFAQVEFTESTLNLPLEIYGYEFENFELGDRG